MTSTSSTAGSGRATAMVRRAQLAGGLLGVAVVGGDDPLDELVAGDGLPAGTPEPHALDVLEDLAHHDQAGLLVAREVDLGDVAGDHHLGAESEPGEEHLHLLG